MVVELMDPPDVVAACRSSLGLSQEQSDSIDDTLLAGLLRRAAGFLCPCSSATLRSAVADSLQFLAEERRAAERIDAVIEGLIVGGDLLELHEVTTEDGAAKATWIFAAPPGLVVRPGGSVFIIGIVPDQDVLLPKPLADRVVYEGVTRVIEPQNEEGEDLATVLREDGFQELSEELWLKTPKQQTPQAVIQSVQSRLQSQVKSGTIEGLQFIDSTSRVTYYRGRWTSPKTHTGMFVARRPQEFGAPIWCVVELENGAPLRFVDLPSPTSRWRGCDAAWHLQMAIDQTRGQPQRFRRLREGGGVRFDFFSPLPLWAERRLKLLGRPVTRQRSLLSYWIPVAEADEQDRFLRERLWLVQSNDE